MLRNSVKGLFSRRSLANNRAFSFSTMSGFYNLKDKNMDGETVSMSEFQGKVLCLVNVASA